MFGFLKKEYCVKCKNKFRKFKLTRIGPDYFCSYECFSSYISVMDSKTLIAFIEDDKKLNPHQYKKTSELFELVVRIKKKRELDKFCR